MTEKKHGTVRRTPREIWHDVRCMEEHLRVFASLVCAITGHKKIDLLDIGIPEDDWNATDDRLVKIVPYGGGGGGFCSGGYPCDGSGDELEEYLEALKEYCELILAELRAVIGTLDSRERIKFCGDMLCKCGPGRVRGTK